MRNSLMARLEGCRFLGVDDLYERKDEIRVEYRDLELWEKEIYKWYFFYQLSLLRNSRLKAELWEYINDNATFDLEWLYEEFNNKREI